MNLISESSASDGKVELKNDTNNLTDNKLQYDDWDARMQSLEKVHENAMHNIVKKKIKQAKNYNKGKRDIHFEIGQSVWKRNKILSSAINNVNAKLAPKYVGPFTIIEKIGRNIYVLERDGQKLDSTTHAKDLKRHVQTPLPTDISPKR